MKKSMMSLLLLICLVMGVFGTAFAGGPFDFVGATSLTGDVNSLDAVKRTKNSVSYKDGTVAVVAPVGGSVSFYIYNAASTASESSPDVIIPNNNKSGKGAWILSGAYGSDGATWSSGANAPSNAAGHVGDYYLRTSNYDVYHKTGVATWAVICNIKGVTGDAGATWLSGADIPDGAIGVVGDYYLRTADMEIYNKTGAAVWTSIGNIKGVTGAAGATWLSGADVPANDLGVVGDYYLRTSDMEIYNKTGAAVWTSIGNIKGDAGAGFVGETITATMLVADPADPVAGDWVQWVAEGTGTGDAGDVMIKINVGDVIKTVTLVDYSAAP